MYSNSAFVTVAKVGFEPTASHVLSVSGLPIAYLAIKPIKLDEKIRVWYNENS